MSKRLLVSMCILAILLAAPMGTAHGTPAARSIDTRILEEGLDSLDYGAANGPAEDGGEDLPVIPLYEGGHDLVALDVRESYGPYDLPGLWMRLVFRRGDPDAGTITDTIRFQVDGREVAVSFSTEDNEAFTSAEMLAVSDKFPTGTYESGVEGFLPYFVIGAAPGAELTEFNVTSYVDDAKTDIMPGTYYYDGERVPSTTEVPGFEPAETPSTYTLQGPAALIEESFAGFPEMALNGSYELTWELTHAAGEVPQFVELEVQAPEGVEAALTLSSMALDNSTATKSVTAQIDVTGPAQGDIVLVARSDIGALLVQRQGIDIAPPAPAQDHDHGDHDHDEEPLDDGADKESPGPGMLVVGLIGLLGALRHKRQD